MAKACQEGDDYNSIRVKALADRLNADLHATTDELYAVGATFTVLAWAFAHLYSVCQLLLPGSFTAMLEPQAARTWMAPPSPRSVSAISCR